jgi:hypothetical protein
MLGFQNLDRIQQQFIADSIRIYKEDMGEEKLKLKLCLAGDSEIELLYRFTKS